MYCILDYLQQTFSNYVKLISQKQFLALKYCIFDYLQQTFSNYGKLFLQKQFLALTL